MECPFTNQHIAGLIGVVETILKNGITVPVNVNMDHVPVNVNMDYEELHQEIRLTERDLGCHTRIP